MQREHLCPGSFSDHLRHHAGIAGEGAVPALDARRGLHVRILGKIRILRIAEVYHQIPALRPGFRWLRVLCRSLLGGRLLLRFR